MSSAPKRPHTQPEACPQRRLGLMPILIVLIACVSAEFSKAHALGPEEEVRQRIEDAFKRKDHRAVVKLADQAIAKKIDLKKSGEPIARSLMALNHYEKAARLLCDGVIVAPTTDILDFVGMGLQTASHKQIEYGVTCLRKAVAMSPDNAHLNYDLGLMLWNAGHIDEARIQCERVLKLDPVNNGAQQILERIEKRQYSGKASKTKTKAKRRKVEFTVTLPRGEAPFLAGSWNQDHNYDQLHGWTRERMPKLKDEGDKVLYGMTKELETEEGPWYAAVVSFTTEPYAPAYAFVRFPLYPYETNSMKLSMDRYKVENPLPLMAPRPQPKTKAKRGPKPRLLALCLDSATWSVFMPYMQAGMMPRLAAMSKNGVVGDLYSDPPITTIAFDILNFGTGGEFTIVSVLGQGIELLKERGIDLLNYGGIRGKNHTWKVLAQKGVSTLYCACGEQFSCEVGGKETAYHLSLDTKTITVSGIKPGSPEEKVLPFLPESERAKFEELTTSDNVILDQYEMGIKKFYELLELMRKTQAQVTLAHLVFVDVGYHAFWDAMDSDLAFFKPDYPRNQRYSKVIEMEHRLFDVLLGEMQSELDLTYDSFILWSDHGTSGGFAKTYYGHDPHAMIVMSGPLFKSGVILKKTMDIRDLTPTLFGALKVDCPKVYNGTPASEAYRSTAGK